jgi:hypothetical protein
MTIGGVGLLRPTCAQRTRSVLTSFRGQRSAGRRAGGVRGPIGDHSEPPVPVAAERHRATTKRPMTRTYARTTGSMNMRASSRGVVMPV